MELKAIKALTAAALLATTVAATAGTSPFSMVGGATAPGIDVSLTVQESVMPGYDYDFVVSNNSLAGTVTGVYFEMDWNSLLTGAGTPSGPAVLNPGSLNPNIADWEGSKASHTVGTTRVRKWVGRGYRDFYYENITDGVEGSEVQTFSFMTDTNIVSLEDLMEMLGSEGYGVAIKMQGLTSDVYDAGWGVADQKEEQLLFATQAAYSPQDNENEGPKVTGAPTPTAALAGVAMLGIVSLRRRRRK